MTVDVIIFVPQNDWDNAVAWRDDDLIVRRVTGNQIVAILLCAYLIEPISRYAVVAHIYMD